MNPYASRLDRRRFLKLGLASGTAAGFGGWLRPASALAFGTQGALYRSLVPEGATPAAKGIDPGWLNSLRLREPAEPVFTKAANQLRYIGMPVGGIGCGTLYLGGDGRLWLWDVWHKSGEGIRPRSRTYQHPNGTSASHANRNGVNYFAPIDVWATGPPSDEKPFPFDQGFALRTTRDGNAATHSLDRTGFADISFRGGYPLATVRYSDPTCPLQVELTAHPVFIPLNTPDSALPATVMEYSLHNPGTAPVEATLLGWMQNPVLLDSGLPPGTTRVNQIRSDSGHAFLECRAEISESGETIFTRASDYTVFADFEGTGYGAWTTTGTAFGTGPVAVPPPSHPSRDLQDVRGVNNRFVNSYLATGGGDTPTGTLTSPAFTVTRGYIHFLLGGGAVSGIKVRLIDAVDSAELRTVSNTSNASTMKWRSWDARDLIGRSVKIVAEDLSSGTWGQLGFDHVCFSENAVPPEYVIFDDFEREPYAPWTTTGTAFGSGPVLISAIPSYQGNVNGQGARVVNSHASAAGNNTGEKDAKTGTLVSPNFTVTHGYLHFLQGGGNNAALTRVRLLRASDNTELRTQTGNNTNTMAWRVWDVRDLRGQEVKISVEDLGTGGWGNVGVDQFLFSTNPASPDASANPATQIDSGSIGIAEIGGEVGRVAAATDVSTAFPWLPGKTAETGGIGRTLTLAPGATATVRFAVTWHFPILPSGLPGNRREYANRFSDAFAVATYLSANWPRLVGDTRLWMDTWRDSSLPHWFLDRSLTTASTLATANCFVFTSGRFYGNEGVNCCAGTCGHVWYYAQTLAHLFPDIERGLRQTVDLNSAVALTASGAVKFRGEYNNDWAWDGQCGVVLRCYREHLASADDTFLTSNWPGIRKVLDFLIAEDGNNDGVSEARQHNTLDADWYGRVPAHIGLYAAALRAGREMAVTTGNPSYATTCETLATAATARMAERFVSSSDYGDGYYVHQLAANLGQLGHADGCYIDQVLGELYARLTGLARVTDASQCRAALRGIWRFAYSHDLTALLSSTAIRQGRPYQMVGEAGLLICTFPNDGNQWVGAWQSGYFTECMTGFEYQVGAHCLAEGLLDEGLTIVRAIYDRYHPSKRNPFNEIECSDHYARAMASYACFLSASGFRHSGPEGMLAFAPTLNPDSFRSAFTAAEGWGSYQRLQQGWRITETVTLKHGSLRLRRFESSVPDGTQGVLAQAKLNNALTSATFDIAGNTLGCALPADLILGPGDIFQITVFSSILPASSDSDDDGLTDLEETSGLDDTFNTPAHDPRGHLTDPSNQDTDHDGTDDGTEARLGTSPLNPGEWFHAAISKDALGRPSLSWPSTTGITFTVQRDIDLSGWQNIVTGYPGQVGLTTFIDTDPLPDAPRVFYRVALDAP